MSAHEKAKIMTDQWIVDMYAQNSYLIKIPQARINAKYKEYYNKYSKESKCDVCYYVVIGGIIISVIGAIIIM